MNWHIPKPNIAGECARPGCDRQVDRDYLMCCEHFAGLPRPIRQYLEAAYLRWEQGREGSVDGLRLAQCAAIGHYAAGDGRRISDAVSAAMDCLSGAAQLMRADGCVHTADELDAAARRLEQALCSPSKAPEGGVGA